MIDSLKASAEACGGICSDAMSDSATCEVLAEAVDAMHTWLDVKVAAYSGAFRAASVLE